MWLSSVFKTWKKGKYSIIHEEWQGFWLQLNVSTFIDFESFYEYGGWDRREAETIRY